MVDLACFSGIIIILFDASLLSFANFRASCASPQELSKEEFAALLPTNNGINSFNVLFGRILLEEQAINVYCVSCALYIFQVFRSPEMIDMLQNSSLLVLLNLFEITTRCMFSNQ